MTKIKSAYPEIALQPINKTSAMVFAKGFTYTPQIKEDVCIEWENMPQTKRMPSNTPSLIGQRCDRVTIVAYYGHARTAGKGNSGTRWVGRCDCGRYVLRRGRIWNRAIRRSTPNMCLHCHKTESLRNKSRNIKNG